VHEYGGGAYTVQRGTVYFSNFADQRLYRQRRGEMPQPITPEEDTRYADAVVTPDGRFLVCVRERHHPQREAINDLVFLPTDGTKPPTVIAAGYNFYSSPRLSPDGQHLAWLCWNHPSMPWDGTELWKAGFGARGVWGEVRRVAGGKTESVFQPEWSTTSRLFYVSDRDGWWKLYYDDRRNQPVVDMEAEFGRPQWVFGERAYAFLPDGRIAATYTRDGFDHLLITDPRGHHRDVELPYTSIAPTMAVWDSRLVLLAAGPAESGAIVALDVDSGATDVLKRGFEADIDPGYVSQPQAISFPTASGETSAHAIFYPPTNKDFSAPAGELPPLIVISHGGPTSQTSPRFSPAIAFWTSRGFGVVDVNYGGSTGYGRAYRERLNGQWGVVDVQDCIAAAKWLAERGEADPNRLAIRGGSAGGYTTLCALVFSDVFRAGASYYGVADLETLETDTHKFESRYSHSLVGPYPERQDLYRERSPIHFADRLSCPVILFQGLEDKVVPPSQAETMAAALDAKGLPYAYLTFEGEQHGFRKAETVQRTLEAELYFYSRVFGFELAEPVEPVEIANLPA
jgi:dipeptidyl aminopeptidase/acylaminoacyl peptidase